MRDSKGFTLIELLIVVVIIGILAAIAIPKFSATREKAYFAAMKSDLKNLASQQEIYYSDQYAYAGTAALLGFTNSDGVLIPDANITGQTDGWSAYATHAAMGSARGCGVYYGGVTTVGGPASPSQPGEIACTN